MKRINTVIIGLVRRSVFIVLVACLGSLCSCSDSSNVDSDTITVSIDPLRNIVEYIADGNFKVKTLTPPGVDPESFIPSKEDLNGLNRSRAFIRMGTLGFEHTQLRKMQGVAPHLLVLSASDQIAPLPHCNHCSDAPGGDPHTWTSPHNMKIVATSICQLLSSIDKENSLDYEQRLIQLCEHIDSVDAEIRQILKDAPTRSFLINHPSLAYFASDYGMHQISIEHDGQPASEEHTNLVEEACRKFSVQTLLLQVQHDSKVSLEVAERLQLKVVEFDPLTYHWDVEFLRLARALVE